MREVNCPLCAGSCFKVVSKKGRERVVKCSCGVVYKRWIDETKKVKHYKKPKIWKKEFFKNRYEFVAKYLWDKAGTEGAIVDIGCATGMMLESMRKHFRKNVLFGVESSVPLHRNVIKSKASIHLVKGSFEDVPLPEYYFDLVLCMGVDYLFLNHSAAMEKIFYILKSFGKLYIERNIFRDMKAFVGKPVESEEVLYWSNMLITNWFTESEMEKQLGKFFRIEDKHEYGEDVSKHVGWLCSHK